MVLFPLNIHPIRYFSLETDGLTNAIKHYL